MQMAGDGKHVIDPILYGPLACFAVSGLCYLAWYFLRIPEPPVQEFVQL